MSAETVIRWAASAAGYVLALAAAWAAGLHLALLLALAAAPLLVVGARMWWLHMDHLSISRQRREVTGQQESWQHEAERPAELPPPATY